jgi:DNA-binding response OmpR family regulator
VGAKVEALDAGADDYVVAPIAPEELLARVRALVRRGRGSGGAVLRCGRLEMDVSSRTVRVDRQRLHLTPREFAVLEFLLRNQQGVVPRSVLHERIWGADTEESSSNVVDVYISRLRRKLRASEANGLIQSVHGTGYIFGLESESSGPSMTNE